ncbi:MAG: MFS transporter [Acidobacteria bacterium]|nr:MFS transporter [Acidobacteriota bacterium]
MTPTETELLRQRKFTTAGILCGLYLAATESTVVTTAMPTVITSLGGLEIYGWVFSIYLLTSTASIPVWGRLSDLYGRRRLYLFGLAIFLGGSLLCGVAGSMPQLILFRAIQGMGAGALLPLTVTIIGELYTFDERARMQGLFSGVWGIASIAGPLTGGFITDHLSWRWVFFINVPIGLIAAAILAVYFLEGKAPAREEHSGIRQGVLLALGLASFLLYVMQGSDNNQWLDWKVLAWMPIASLLFWLYVRMERKSTHAFIPPELLDNRMFVAACATSLCIGMVYFGVIAFLPLFSQEVLGRSATEAGSTITPALLTWVCFSVLMGRLLRRSGFRKPVFCGMVLLVIGTRLIANLGDAPPRSVLILAMICLGAGMGLNSLPVTIGVQSAVPRQSLGIATASVHFFRSIGGALGAAIMGSRLSSHIARALREHPGPELAGFFRHPEAALQTHPGVNGDLAALFRSTLASGLASAFFVSFVFSLVAFLSAFLVPKEFENIPLDSKVRVTPGLE